MMLNNKERDIIYKLIEEAKPTASVLMGEKVLCPSDMALYDQLNKLEQKLKSSDSRYEPVSREEYEARGGK